MVELEFEIITLLIHVTLGTTLFQFILSLIHDINTRNKFGSHADRLATLKTKKMSKNEVNY